MENTDLMPFGKHKGIMMQDVPAEYLLEFVDAEIRENSITKPVLEYIEKNREILEIEVNLRKDYDN